MKRINIPGLVFLLIVSLSSYAQNIGVGTDNPQRKVHVGGAANTIRVDGLSDTGTFSITPSAASHLLLYTNASGDILSVPAGSAGNLMTINGSGVISWMAPVSTAWNMTGNGSTNPASNFIGTTDAKNLVFRTNSANANGGWSGFIEQTGNNSTFFGYLAGQAIASTNNANATTDNTAFGANALSSNTFAMQNTAIGSGALQYQRFGSSLWPTDNTAVGYKALNSNQPTSTSFSGFRNTAVGSQAMVSNSTGYDNCAFGYEALLNSTGRDNCGFGINTLQSNSGVQNTAVGNAAMSGNINGNYNTAVGYQAMQGGNSGTKNAAFGQSALYNNTKASFNTAIGSEAMMGNTVAQYNVAVGFDALVTQSYGTILWASANTAIGYNALYSNQPTSTTTGYQNTAVGDSAMFANTTGSYNTASGYQSMALNKTGSTNTAYGTTSMPNTTSDANTAVGYNALFNNTSGSYNTAVGIYALNGINPPFTGMYNVGLGEEALRRTGSGSFNTGLGSSAMYYNQGGSYNTAVGYYAGNTSVAANGNVTGSYNVFVGYSSGPGVANANSLQNAVAIGAYATVNQSNSMVLGSISGVNGASSGTKVGIGTASPNSILQVNGSFALAINAVTASYALTATDAIVTADATSGSVTNTLPTAVGINGRQYTIKRIDNSSGNAVTVATTSAQMIDGVSTYSLSGQWKYVTVVSDGANWIIVSNN